MNKLKTLEDIELPSIWKESSRKKVLRQEATNHIIFNKNVKPIPKFDKSTHGRKLKLPKPINELNLGGEKIELSDKELIKCMLVLNAWIKYFFNVTEEDSK